MKVLVDTSVWSLALRRRPSTLGPVDAPVEEELRALLGDGRVVLVGPVRQELLSGIRSAEAFEALRERLRAFEDLRLTEADHEAAADCFNRCRARGVQGSNTDFLLCAVSIGRGLPLFTTDRDFVAFEAVLPLKLHPPRPSAR